MLFPSAVPLQIIDSQFILLSGLLAAALNRWFYRGKRPSALAGLVLGAEIEILRMYFVLALPRDGLPVVYLAVKTYALQLVAFAGIGLALCFGIIGWISGSRWKMRLRASRKEMSIERRFQLWLTVLVMFFFSCGLGLNYYIQTRLALEEAILNLEMQQLMFSADYGGKENAGWDIAALKDKLTTLGFSTGIIYTLVDQEQGTCYCRFDGYEEPITDPCMETLLPMIREHADGAPFSSRWIPGLQNTGFEIEQNSMCASVRLGDSYYLLISMRNKDIYEDRAFHLMESIFLQALFFSGLYLLINVLVNRLIIRNLNRVNRSLGRITAGNLTEVVAVEESSEFSSLSADINQTVSALRELIDASEKRMEEEQQLAADIQNAALHKNFRMPPKSMELFASMTPTRQVGGDFYDFFLVDADRMVLVMADVSGKGIPAAMFMMRAKTAIKNFTGLGMGPGKILENVNNFLCEDNATYMFVTVWLGILDLKTGRMRCANAGHEYPFLMRAGGNYAVLEDEHGLVLGGFADVTEPEYEILLEPGDRVFVYTDGIPEAAAESGEQYGMERLAECLNRNRNKPQEQMLAGMLEDIRAFAGQAEQSDGITMMGFTYIGGMARAPGEDGTPGTGLSQNTEGGFS